MPRPREFDEQEVVARAADLFHRRGFHATSTRDLGEALQLNPSSLYRTFGDKHALFLRALDHYQACQAEAALAALADTTRPVRDVLRSWLGAGIEPGGTDPPGCFVINTATELGTSDPQVQRRVREALDGTASAVAGLLRRGMDRAELPADLDPDAAAELLVTTFAGLRVRAMTGQHPARLQAAAEHAIQALG